MSTGVGRPPLFNARSSVRWVRDNTLAPAKDPEAFVEFWVWDRLPGQVMALVNESVSSAETLPPHLLVAPALPIDRPNNKWGVPATNLRVLARWVRRIVWQPAASRYQPNTVFYRDGRQSSYRRLRFAGESIRLLRDEGVEEVPLSAIAELHLPAADAWDAYFEQLAALDPDGKARIMQLETAQGLRVTTSDERFQADFDAQNRRPDRDQDPERRWYHRVAAGVERRSAVAAVRADSPAALVSAAARAAFLLRARGQPPAIDPGRGLAMDGRPQRAGRSARGGPATLRLGLWSPGDQRIGIPAARLCPLVPHAIGDGPCGGRRGAARALVLFDAGTRKPLYESPLLVGAGRVLDTGPLPVELPTGQAGRLVLRAEMAGDDRPEHADPLDIRAIFDWLEPELELDPGRLRGGSAAAGTAADSRLAGLDRSLQPGGRSFLANYWDESPTRPAYRLGRGGRRGSEHLPAAARSPRKRIVWCWS